MPSPSRESPAIVAAFLARVLDDREADGLRPLAAYQAQFPGHEDTIARRYRQIEERTMGPEASLESTGPGGLGPGGRVAHYELLRELGRGGQGTVYLAEDARLGRRVALKVLAGMGVGLEARLQRFRREAEVASRLDHAGICAVYDSGIADGVPYIAMRFVEGEPLTARLAAARETSDDERRSVVTVTDPTSDLGDARAVLAPFDDLLGFFERAARALHAAHECGVIHRDIKPGNIMVGPGGEPVLLDFGLARDTDEDHESLTLTGDVFGTPAYMAPEQIAPEVGAVDRRADVWALGVTLYESVCGRRPFESPTRAGLCRVILERDPVPPSILQPLVPRDLSVVIQAALTKDRQRRYATALAFAEDLRCVRARLPIAARPAGWGLRLRLWARRQPALAASLLALLLSLVSGLILSLVLLGESDLKGRRLERSLKSEADERIRANGLRLLAQATALTEDDPTLALLLALHGADQAPGEGGQETLEALGRLREVVTVPSIGPVNHTDRMVVADDGAALAISWRGGGVGWWDLANGRERFRTGNPGASIDPGPSRRWLTPDARALLVDNDDLGACLLDARTGDEIMSLDNDDRVDTASFATRARRVAVCAPRRPVRVFDLETGAEVDHTGYRGMGRRGPFGSPFGLSPDGKMLVIPHRAEDGDYGVRLRDVDAGKDLRLCLGQLGPVYIARFDPTGRRIFTACATGIATLWDVSTGRRLRSLSVGPRQLAHPCFSPDGRRFASPVDGSPLAVAVVDARSGVRLGRLPVPSQELISLSFSPDGSRLVGATPDRRIIVWNIAQMRVQSTFVVGTAPLQGIGFGLGGERLWAVDASGQIFIMHGRMGADRFQTGSRRPIVAVGNGRDGVRVLRRNRGELELVDPSDPGAPRHRIPGSNVIAANFDRTATRVAVTEPGGRVRVMIVADGGEFATLDEEHDTHWMLWGPDGLLLCALVDGGAVLWDVGAKRRLAYVERTDGVETFAARFTKDGNRVLLARRGHRRARQIERSDPVVFVLDTRTGKIVARVDGMIASRGKGELGARFAVVDRGVVRVHAVADGAKVAQFDVGRGALRSARLSPDGSRCVVWSQDGSRLDFFDVAIGQRVGPRVPARVGPIADVVFTPDGGLALVVAEPGGLRVHDGRTGEDVALLAGHRAPITGVAVSKDGRRALTTSHDGSARLWNLETLRCVLVYGRRETVLEAPAFDDSGRFAIARGEDRSLWVWPLDPVAVARRLRPRDMRIIELERFELGDQRSLDEAKKMLASHHDRAALERTLSVSGLSPLMVRGALASWDVRPAARSQPAVEPDARDVLDPGPPPDRGRPGAGRRPGMGSPRPPGPGRGGAAIRQMIVELLDPELEGEGLRRAIDDALRDAGRMRRARVGWLLTAAARWRDDESARAAEIVGILDEVGMKGPARSFALAVLGCIRSGTGDAEGARNALDRLDELMQDPQWGRDPLARQALEHLRSWRAK